MDSEHRIEGDEQAGWTVSLDGHPQSHVDLRDPANLAFEYIQLFATVIDALSPRGILRVTHVGGGGLTLPRWVAHTRPGSPQIVLEPDAVSTEAVRTALPLPRGHRVRVRPVDGSTGVGSLRSASADVVVLDAYADGRIPAELVATSFLAACARVLTLGGLLLANVADEPNHAYAARVAAGARSVLGQTAYVATSDVLKKRRFGNVVIVASRAPIDIDELRRHLARQPFPAGVWDDAQIRRKSPAARPFNEHAAIPSPTPPDAGSWRVR